VVFDEENITPDDGSDPQAMPEIIVEDTTFLVNIVPETSLVKEEVENVNQDISADHAAEIEPKADIIDPVKIEPEGELSESVADSEEEVIESVVESEEEIKEPIARVESQEKIIEPISLIPEESVRYRLSDMSNEEARARSNDELIEEEVEPVKIISEDEVIEYIADSEEEIIEPIAQAELHEENKGPVTLVLTEAVRHRLSDMAKEEAQAISSEELFEESMNGIQAHGDKDEEVKSQTESDAEKHTSSSYQRDLIGQKHHSDKSIAETKVEPTPSDTAIIDPVDETPAKPMVLIAATAEKPQELIPSYFKDHEEHDNGSDISDCEEDLLVESDDSNGNVLEQAISGSDSTDEIKPLNESVSGEYQQAESFVSPHQSNNYFAALSSVKSSLAYSEMSLSQSDSTGIRPTLKEVVGGSIIVSEFTYAQIVVGAESIETPVLEDLSPVHVVAAGHTLSMDAIKIPTFEDRSVHIVVETQELSTEEIEILTFEDESSGQKVVDTQNLSMEAIEIPTFEDDLPVPLFADTQALSMGAIEIPTLVEEELIQVVIENNSQSIQDHDLLVSTSTEQIQLANAEPQDEIPLKTTTREDLNQASYSSENLSASQKFASLVKGSWKNLGQYELNHYEYPEEVIAIATEEQEDTVGEFVVEIAQVENANIFPEEEIEEAESGEEYYTEQIQDDDSEEELAAHEPDEFADQDITDIRPPSVLLLGVRAAINSYKKKMDSPITLSDPDQLTIIHHTFIRHISLTRLVNGMVSWKTFGAIVDLSSFYLYREMFEQVSHHTGNAKGMLSGLRISGIKPTRNSLESVCTMNVNFMYTAIENKSTKEAIACLQRAMESVSKVYRVSIRIEKMIKVAKADLESCLGNYEDAAQEYEEMQEETSDLPGEIETEKIINLSRIAKVFYLI
jgi:hypothetical protein